LVRRAQGGEREAFGALYDRYLGRVYAYCYRVLGNHEAAEDANAEVFERALMALPKYRTGSFRSWLFAIAHNTVADSYRSQRPELPLDAVTDVPDVAAAPEERALAADELRALRAQLARLSPDQRQVVELRLAGLTDLEIAQVLGRSHGAVRMSQFRAVARLRALLGVEPNPKETDDGDA
jgi:RNA polymerase sigma-70 factor, ECF subfamily